MLIIPGQRAKDVCDSGIGLSRRALLRVGGSSILGMSLSGLIEAQAAANDKATATKAGSTSPGWGKAKSILFVFLQGGPSQLDLWDPKHDVPDTVKSPFSTIQTKLPGIEFTEMLPQLAQVNDKFTMIRSMSYTPNGLFNHTAAIYQMHTGYTADKVSPSGQLEPPTPKDFPTFGSQLARLRPLTEPMLPFVMLPRPLQESNVIGKGGAAGFLGRAFDPYTLYPPGADAITSPVMDGIKVDDLRLRPEITADRLQRRARLRESINAAMPDIDKATAKYNLGEYYNQALGLILSGRARDAFDLKKESNDLRDRYGCNVFGQCLLLGRRLIEAGTRVVEVIWPQVANGAGVSWDMHIQLPSRTKAIAQPILDPGLATLFADMDQRGLLDETLVVVAGEFGRSPQRGLSTSGNENDADGRDHWPYCYTAIMGGAGIKRGFVYGKSDKTASAPTENPMHPIEMLATIYHAFGIDPKTIVYNHLNQPRELVQAEAVTTLFM